MKKSILIIHESLDGGGAERVLTEYLNNIDYSVYDITLVLLYGGGRYLREINRNVNYVELFPKLLKPKYGFMEKIIYNKFVIRYRILRLIHVRKFDVLLSFMEGPALKIHSYLLDYAIKHVTWVHTNMITNPWSTRYFGSKENEELTYTQMNHIVFVSQLALESFTHKYPGNIVEKRVINNPIDAKRIMDDSELQVIEKGSSFTICSVGRIVDAKRYDRLVEAAVILKNMGCKINYWICGTGKLEHQIKNLIKNKHLEDTFTFWGFQNNPYPYIKSADAFVLCSDSEGFPTVICEAMILGKPIVSTDVAGTDELLGKSEYGIVCNKEAQSLAEAIKLIYKDIKIQSQLSTRAKQKSSMFNISQTLEKFYAVINE